MKLISHSIDSLGIVTITLNDEANLNAMSDEMALEFSNLTESLRGSSTAKVLILTGAGRAFSAGGHLEMLDSKRSRTAEVNRADMLKFYRSFLGILELKIPIIAALHGSAVGAGLCLACAADIRIATSDTKLGFTFLKLGLHPGMGGTFLVSRIVGPAVATELMLTGRMISAEEGFRLGLVSRLCSKDELLKVANSIAEEILSCGELARGQLLETMRGDLVSFNAALEREADCQSLNYSSAEFAERLGAIKARVSNTNR
jgi:enoyl-CoA hydratase